MAVEAGTAWVRIRPDLSRMSGELSKGLDKASSGLTGFGKQMSLSVTAPIVAAAGAAGFFGLATAASLEQAEVAFTTLTGSAETGKKVLEDLKQLGAITPFETADLTTTAQRLLNAGVATDDLTKAITFLGDAAGTQGAQGLDRLGFAYSQILGAGRAMTEDINQIADVGVPIWGELAAQLGTTQGEVRKMASEGQISADLITAAFEAPIGPMKNLVGGMAAQSETLTGMWSTLKDTLGQGLADSLAQSMPDIKTALGDITEALGPALEAAGPAFTALVQAAVPLAGALADVLTWFAGLSPEMQQMIVYAVAGAAAVGPVALGMGRVAKAAELGGKTLGTLGKGFGKVAGAIFPVWKQLTPLGRVMVGFGSIGKIFTTLGRTLFKFGKVVALAMKIVGRAFLMNPIGLLVTAIAAAAFLIWKYWDEIKAAFAAAWEWIKPILQAVWETVKGAFDKVVEVLSAAVGWIADVFRSIWETVQPIWDTFWSLITLPMRIWWAVVSAVFQLAWAFIKHVFDAIVGFVVPLWQQMWDTIAAAATTVWDWISGLLTAAWGWITGVFTRIRDTVTAVWSSLWDTIRAVWDTVYGFLATGVAAARDRVVNAFENMKDRIRAVWDGIKNIITGAVDAVQGIASGIWSGLKSVINSGIGLLNDAIRGFNKIITSVNKVPGVSVPTIPSIPRLADGGIVSAPTIALVGEAGPEAVIPLSALGRFVPEQSKPADTLLQVYIGDRDITDMIESVTRRQTVELAGTLARGRRL